MAKRNGMRKAYLKRFAGDQVKPRGGQKADRTWLLNAQESAEKQKVGEFQQMDADGFPVAELWHGGVTPRSTVIKRLEEQQIAQGTRFQRIIQWNYVALIKTKKQELRMYFQGNEFLLVEMDLFLEKVRRSTVFNDKKKLLSAFKMKALTWVESSSL